MDTKQKYPWMPFLMLVIMVVLYWSISYQTARSEFYFFFGQYLLLFGAFYWFWLNTNTWGFKKLMIIALGLRLISIAAIPELSDDFFRFLWDGELMSKGVNPFSHTPNELISYSQFYHDDYMREVLYHGMTPLSQSHYSCYPVINQFIFFIPAVLFNSVGSSIVLLKIILILADIGAIFIARKILVHFNKPTHLLWLFALNPLIILEFSGNLHFEGIMIFFLLAGIYYLMKNKWLTSSTFIALAIQTKLLPLIVLPFVLKKLKWRRSIGYLAMCAIVVILLGLMLLNSTLTLNLLSSVGDYFTAFEFNAGVFYLIREIGFAVNGWDPIEFAGPLLSVFTAVLILLVAIFRAYREELDLIKGMLFAFLIYYLLATTVHPWYVSTILVLSVFTVYKFGLVWSLLVMLSYFAYSNPEFKENYFFIITEYLLLYLILFLELRWNTRRENIRIQFKDFFSAPTKETSDN